MLIKTKQLPIFTYFILTLAMLFWGLSFIWYKQVLVALGSITLITIRLVLSSAILLGFLLLTGRFQKIFPGDLKYFLTLAFFEPFLYFIGESVGIQFISASLASILVATIPLFTPLSAYLFHKEKLGPNNFAGLVLSFFGVVLVILSDAMQYIFSVKGVLLMMMAVFATQGYVVILKKLRSDYRATNIVVYQNIFGTMYFIPVFVIFELRDFELGNLLLVWKPVLYLVVLASTVAFLCFTKGVRAIGMSKANVFTNFIPVFAAIFAFFYLQEPISAQKVIGILLTILGVIMTQATNFPFIRIYSRVK